jgi:hypothetical protein
LLYVAEESEKINNIIGTSIQRDENWTKLLRLIERFESY